MRKWIVPVVALVMALSMILVLPGCGGDTKQAQQLAKDVKAVEADIEEMGTELETEIQSVFTEAFASGTFDAAKFQTGVDKIKSQLDDVLAKAEPAKKDLEKIKTLKGVENYVKWADIQLELLDLAAQSADKLNAFFDEIAKMAQSGSVDVQALQTATQQFEEEMGSITKKQEELQKEATDLETKYKLI